MSRKTLPASRFPVREVEEDLVFGVHDIDHHHHHHDQPRQYQHPPQKPTALYTSPAVRMPSLDQLMKIAGKCGIDLSPEELKAYGNVMRRTIQRMNEASRLPEPTLPVKYPRTPGHRPRAEENPFNAWSHMCEIRGAKYGKLAGKRVAVKDNIAVAGVPLMNGSHALEGYVPDFDATVVTRVLDAGGQVCGKTACEDFCYSGSSFTGAGGPVLNPHDTARSAGGSSSGSAVAIVTGDVDMALGTDQGGSIRIPAAFCGVVGLKPTYGLVPFTGSISTEPTIDHIGPMARTVDDCALLLEVIAGYDNGLDHRQHPSVKVPQYTKEIQSLDIDGERIGLLAEGLSSIGNGCLDERVKERVNETLFRLHRGHGVDVRNVSVPIHKFGSLAFTCFAKEGINAAMLQNGGGGYGHHGFYPSSMMSEVGKAIHTRINDMSHRIKLTRLIGEYMKEKYQGRFYAKGRNLVLALRAAYDDALQRVDILALPTVPYTATRLPAEDCSVEDHFNMSSTCALNTTPFNCTGHPAISVPVGKIDGLPVGLTLVGRHFDEVRLFRVAKVIERMQLHGSKSKSKDITARL